MRNLGALIMVLSLFSSSAFSDEASCRITLTKCDLAVKALQKDNNAKQFVIDSQDNLIRIQGAALDESRAWYRDPTIIIPLGLVIGFAGGVYIIRR